MGKKDDLAGDLVRGRSIKKKTLPTADEAAKVAEKVTTNKSMAIKEDKKETSKPANKQEKKLIRTTIDLPAYVHKAIKVKAAQEGISLKKYLVSLVKNDLELD